MIKNSHFSTHIPYKVETVKQFVLSRPPHLLKVQSVPHQSFQDHHILLKWKLFKMSPLMTPHPPKVEIIQNQSFPRHLTLPKYLLSIISPYKTTTSSQSEHCKNFTVVVNVLFQEILALTTVRSKK